MDKWNLYDKTIAEIVQQIIDEVEEQDKQEICLKNIDAKNKKHLLLVNCAAIVSTATERQLIIETSLWNKILLITNHKDLCKRLTFGRDLEGIKADEFWGRYVVNSEFVKDLPYGLEDIYEEYYTGKEIKA